MKNLNFEPTDMSWRPSVQPLMTSCTPKVIGSPRWTELSKTLPLVRVPW